MEWHLGGPPAICGYYLGLWDPGGGWTVSELWFEPVSGWRTSRGYLGERQDRHVDVVAWMPMPEYPGDSGG